MHIYAYSLSKQVNPDLHSFFFRFGDKKVRLNHPASHYLWVRQQGALQVIFSLITHTYVHTYMYIW